MGQFYTLLGGAVKGRLTAFEALVGTWRNRCRSRPMHGGVDKLFSGRLGGTVSPLQGRREYR
jgi:hypothetical protein